MDVPTIVERSRGPRPGSARTFAALSDPARLTILRSLRGGTACLCELAPALGIAPNLLSYHLRILREAGLIEGTRRGRRVEYRARPAQLQRLAFQLIDLAVRGDGNDD